MTVRKGGLGRGLDALLPVDISKLPDSVDSGGYAVISLDNVVGNVNQPRKNFDPVELDEMAESIKSVGVLVPVLVEKSGGGMFTVIAGERRVRAARLAGLAEIPVIIKKLAPEESFLAAVIENLQRADLNPIEEALAFKNLMDIKGFNQEEVAAKVGKNRATISNALRLLKLPAEIQDALVNGKISAGHARALLSLENGDEQTALFGRIMSGSLSVREAEKLAGESAPRAGGGSAKKTSGGNAAPKDSGLVSIENKFIEALGTKVSVDGTLDSGFIKIEYYSQKDLDRLYNIFVDV